MNQLEEIKTRIERIPQVAPGVVSEEVADALKLLAALEAVEGVLKKLDAIQKEDNVSRNACAGGIANVIRDVIAEETQ